MDAAKRERVIELGAQITGLRGDIALLQSKLTETEAELDRLFSDSTPSSNGAVSAAPTLGAAGAATAPPMVRLAKSPDLIIPQIIGNLSDQALAVLKANPDRELTGEAITDCMNRMAGRTASAVVDSVNAALSRLTTDGLILRVERGIYKAKPAMNSS